MSGKGYFQIDFVFIKKLAMAVTQMFAADWE